MADSDLEKSADFTQFLKKYDGGEDPVIVAQRFLNIFRQLHIFTNAKRKDFDDLVLKLPTSIRGNFSSLSGGSVLQEYVHNLEKESGVEISSKDISPSKITEVTEDASLDLSKLDKDAISKLTKSLEKSYTRAAGNATISGPLTLVADESFKKGIGEAIAEALNANIQAQQKGNIDLARIINESQNKLAGALAATQKDSGNKTAEDIVRALAKVMRMDKDAQQKNNLELVKIISLSQTRMAKMLAASNARAAEEEGVKLAMPQIENMITEVLEKQSNLFREMSSYQSSKLENVIDTALKKSSQSSTLLLVEALKTFQKENLKILEGQKGFMVNPNPINIQQQYNDAVQQSENKHFEEENDDTVEQENLMSLVDDIIDDYDEALMPDENDTETEEVIEPKTRNQQVEELFNDDLNYMLGEDIAPKKKKKKKKKKNRPVEEIFAVTENDEPEESDIISENEVNEEENNTALPVVETIKSVDDFDIMDIADITIDEDNSLDWGFSPTPEVAKVEKKEPQPIKFIEPEPEPKIEPIAKFEFKPEPEFEPISIIEEDKLPQHSLTDLLDLEETIENDETEAEEEWEWEYVEEEVEAAKAPEQTLELAEENAEEWEYIEEEAEADDELQEWEYVEEEALDEAGQALELSEDELQEWEYVEEEAEAEAATEENTEEWEWEYVEEETEAEELPIAVGGNNNSEAELSSEIDRNLDLYGIEELEQIGDTSVSDDIGVDNKRVEALPVEADLEMYRVEELEDISASEELDTPEEDGAEIKLPIEDNSSSEPDTIKEFNLAGIAELGQAVEVVTTNKNIPVENKGFNPIESASFDFEKLKNNNLEGLAMSDIQISGLTEADNNANDPYAAPL